MENELYHHGILGQKWGVRRYQNPDGSLTEAGKKRYSDNKTKTVKINGLRARATNFEKWGQDKEHNLLGITGPSGSGKTSIAYALKDDRNAELISMDFYWNAPSSPYAKEWRNPGFDKYIAKHVPEFRAIEDDYARYRKAKFSNKSEDDNDRKFYWQTMDKIRDAMFAFAKESFPKPIIAEGVQWSDTTLFPDNSARKGKMENMPFLVADTSPALSTVRGMIRDEQKTSIKTFLDRYKDNKNWKEQALEVEDWVRRNV